MIPISLPSWPPQQIIVEYSHKVFHPISFIGDIKVVQSHKIWSDFAEISNIYRESGHNQEISDYLKKRLQKSGFKVEQKENDGTIVATRGLNQTHNNAIILQAHMDIVAISKDGNSKKPIQTHIIDGWLYANERTLGADNGLGVAAILAIADDTRFKNYPLEMIITTDEETGMDGARKLNAKDFYGKYLINLDSEEYGDITKGCAGIAQFNVTEKIKMRPLESNDYKQISISLKGARGGHSAEITPDCLNPIIVILSELNDEDIKLVSISGGERYNAIPRDAQAEILIPKSKAEAFLEKLNANLAKIKEEKLAKNPNFEYKISSEDAKSGTKYIDQEFQTKMFKAFNSIPIGLLSKFDDNGCTKTSQNLGILKISDGTFSTIIMGRSSDKKEKQELTDKTSVILSELVSKQVSLSDSTPIWQPQPESTLEKAAVKALAEVSNGQKATVKVEHGGLESAIFTEKAPYLEQISIGPTIEEPHSIQERVKIDTVVHFYDWLCKILELLK